jgi:hypothetical protein
MNGGVPKAIYISKIISKHITAPIKENPIEIQQTPT